MNFVNMLREGIEAGAYPSLQPIIFSGSEESAKRTVSLDLASKIADEKNIFRVEMDADTAMVQAELSQAIEIANEGEPTVVIYDLNGKESLNEDFELSLLHFIATGKMLGGIGLEEDNKSNLFVMIVREAELEISCSLDFRCITINEHDMINTDTLVK